MHKLFLAAAAAVIGAALSAAPAAAQTLEKIKQRGVLVVGSKADYKPFGFREREFFSAQGDTAVPEVSFAAGT